MPAEPNPPEPAAPQIVVPPEVADAVRAAGYASLVAEDGRPLLRLWEETEEDRRRLADRLFPPEEMRAAREEWEAAGRPTVTWEQILADLPDERPTAEAA